MSIRETYEEIEKATLRKEAAFSTESSRVFSFE